jgi:hypothetical protein
MVESLYQRWDVHCPLSGKVKVNLSLCFNWAPRHKGVLGEWRYSPHAFLIPGIRWRRLISFKPRPLYPQEKNPWYPLNRWSTKSPIGICSAVVLLHKEFNHCTVAKWYIIWQPFCHSGLLFSFILERTDVTTDVTSRVLLYTAHVCNPTFCMAVVFRAVGRFQHNISINHFSRKSDSFLIFTQQECFGRNFGIWANSS